MHPQNITDHLFRRLISVFALMDGWIDQWQRELPETSVYQSQCRVLSDMINALSMSKLPYPEYASEKHLDHAGAVTRSTQGPKHDVKDDPDEMRKILRYHLGELLWLLDQHETPGGNETDVVGTATTILQVMSACLEELNRLDKPVEDLSS